jgi:branched-subunit amino acid aminotransferase/4-amino-4-deoxychorismate lyase
MQAGARLVTPTVRQVPPECWSPHLKCRSRMHYFLADREARRCDPEASALLLDLAGRVTETSTSNFLMFTGAALVSPPAEAILPGISREMVRALAGALHIPFVERGFFLDEALHADEAFTTSTPYCLMPVTRINGVAIGSGRPGPLFRRLLTAWSAAVGLDIGAQIHDVAQQRLRRGNECAS